MSKNKKHIAIFLPGLQGGGAERVTVLLAEGLFNAGYQVDVVVMTSEGEMVGHLPKGVSLVSLETRKLYKTIVPLARYLRGAKPDVLLSVMYGANYVAILAKLFARLDARHIITEHTTFSTASKKTHVLRRLFYTTVRRLLYRYADALVAVSEGVLNDTLQATGFPREKATVIYNPVVSNEMLLKSKEPVSHPWFLERDLPVVLAVGRFVEAKDYPTLINAFAQVLKTKQARLLILGEGPLREELQCLINELGISDSVDLHGFVENPYAYMRTADLFVLSSAWEGLGNVLIEAMSCGTPVVSTNCPSGPAEILENGKWGQLVPVGDVGELAKAIMNVLDGNVIKPGIESVGRFRVETVVRQYLDGIERSR